MEKKLPVFEGMKLRELFPILQTLLADTYRCDAYLLSYPYEGIERIDRGFRKTIWDHYDSGISALSNNNVNASKHQFLIVKSVLGFYSLTILIPAAEAPDMISIGPFRNEEVNLGFIQRVINENELNADQMSTVKQFYQALPLIDPEDIANTVMHLISAFIPEFLNVKIRRMNFSEEERHVAASHERLDSFSVDFAKNYNQHQKQILEAVASGNVPDSIKAVNDYITFVGLDHNGNLKVLKKYCHALNTLLYQVAVDNNVHPIYALRQYTDFDNQIDNSGSVKVFQRMPFDLAHKYTILINNYSFKEFSFLVRSIRNYVDLHIEEELTLAVISKHFEKNASYVSSLFKSEVGCNLTDYIQLEKIHAAIKLLNTTDLSIAQVAATVGYTDFGYFTKIFKKHIGHTPSDYRKMMKNETN
ncbi:MAG: helix-turn-helix domain-containing protein [Pseudobutyrivibrio sp.]|nr:helix-turn-helix domain-containing protein [Pseudobutyrivibrio sp.]MCF0185680.1 helix-turn-helix domain-containing protein [Bacteroidaceae bacterium]